MCGTSSTLDTCIASGGIALFPADTVYGLACDPENAHAIKRLYALKRRPPERAAAVMFFAVDALLAAVPEPGPRTRAALHRLLPGGVTVLLPNPAHRFPLACAADRDTLGVRVVDVPQLAAARAAVLQSSANLAGHPAPRRLEDVAPELRDGVDVTVEGGELPGIASTVLDLRGYEFDGRWSIARTGAVSPEDLSAALVSSNP